MFEFFLFIDFTGNGNADGPVILPGSNEWDGVPSVPV